MAMTTANTPRSPADMNDALHAGHENGQKLLNVIERARCIADFVSGPVPRPADEGRGLMGGGGLVERLATHFNAEAEALADLSSELARVERALGMAALNIPDAAQAGQMGAAQMRGRF